jgi:O-antigen ligase
MDSEHFSNPTQNDRGVTLPGVAASAKPGKHRIHPGGRSDRVTWGLLVLLLAFAPLAFGAVEYWSIAVVELLSLGLAFAWIVAMVRRNEITIHSNLLLWTSIGLLVWITFQLVSGHTLDRSSTRDDLFLLCSYFLVFVVVSNAHWSPRWIRRLAFAIAIIGCAVAAFGIIQLFSWNGKLYWIRPIEIGTPFGPFVNRNHFAGLMEMTFPVGLSLIFSRTLAPAWKGLLVFFCVIMTLATFMSLSRGGMAAFTLAFLVFVYLLSRRRAAGGIVWLAGLLMISSVLWIAWAGSEPVVQRVLTVHELSQEASYSSRLSMAADTIQIIKDHPLMGTGLGTLRLAYPKYQSWFTNQKVFQAHNDYLQFLSEVGLVGFSLALIWIAGLFHSIIGMVREESEHFSLLRLGAFCGCLAILIHSFVDFNLQIPSNALYFAVLAALASRKDIGRISSS